MHAEEPPRAARAKRLPRAVRERQILDAAVAVFARHGFHTASMDEISEVAGISKPMLYAYLGSKEDLYVACLRREGERLMAAIEAGADPAAPPDVQLWRGLRAFFGFVAEHADGWRVLHQPASAAGGQFAGELAALRGRMIGLVGRLLVRAVSNGNVAAGIGAATRRDTDGLAAALVGAGESMADWWLAHPDEPVGVVASRLMNLAWMGFGDLVEGRMWVPPHKR
ncbi:TetR/AcrR family transcriptional regulator [Gandjariella thermophila]|uniref:TetR family transcriptional regulator n=1 Tax=Gandjariella thermophila TaxID=1931992 RepID=A0A4D4J2Y3_9PSEU|nr:TetR/AcrR family transcriptional regulator [Gandjariella thermophila]GDY30841.1 TetR family transcriptional regulator [Gandjariella thermophila]